MLGRRTGLWISNSTVNSRAVVEQVVLTEHPIDGMSYYQLHKKEVLKTNTVFLSTAGNPAQGQVEAVKEFINRHKVSKVVLAHDNDPAGAVYNKEYLQWIRGWNKERKEKPVEVEVARPVFKDFNADIKARKWLELRQLEQQDIASPKHLLGLHPLKEEVARLLYEKNYPELAGKEVRKELQEGFVVKEVEGLNTRFSIREVALINNQSKLLKLLEKEEPQKGLVGAQMERQGPQAKEPKAGKGKERVEESLPRYDRPAANRAVKIPIHASDQQLEKAYFKSIHHLQQQIKGLPQFREQYQRLELYKKYPHLNEEEVDTYLGLMQQRRSAGIQQEQAITKGKGKGLTGQEF